MRFSLLLSTTILATLTACQHTDNSKAAVTSGSTRMQEPSTAITHDAQPPRAAAKPKVLSLHGHERQDDYYWLNQREDPEVIDYLEAENAYLETQLKHTEEFQEELFKEIVGRIKQDDSSVPTKDGDYFYYTRFEEGQEYAIVCRRRAEGRTMAGDEEVLLNGNKLAAGHDFFSLRGNAISSGQDLLAYAVDTIGRRIYTIQFKNLATGETLADTIPNVTGNMAWAEDNRTLFYTKQDLTTLRSHQIYRHVLGTDPARDELVFEETDDTFSCYVQKTKSKRFMFITSSQTLSTEVRFLDAKNPSGDFRVLEPRRRDHEYWADHYGDDFFLVTNDQAKNFRLMKTPITATERENWTEVIPHRKDVLLSDIEIFQNFLVLSERQNGLREIRVRPWSGDGAHDLDFGEPAYSCWLTGNLEFDTPVLRYGYTSMTTPRSTFEYDMTTHAKELLKQDEVLGGFDSANYVTERLMAPARDGARVPISLVYRKGFERDGSHPALLYGYGSYGSSMDASFRSSRLSLLDRGFVFAIAHIRGGEEMGRHWYEDGKLLKKKNTFTDFIDCGEYLIEQEYAAPEHLFAMGGSAGGLLMGAVVNLRPDLFRGVVAAVPFVDVVTTMLDDSIPLTTSEYDEWGNPNDKKYFEYMLSYSPYDNVETKDYPNMLVTTGLHDSQVQYFEPAKWVAKLRARKTDDNLLVLKTNMEAGHGGASGRFRRLRETALEFAFLLDLVEIRE